MATKDETGPERVLKVTGRSRTRLIGTHDFFILAAAVGWVGEIRCQRLQGRGWPWEIVYRGPWVQQYADLLVNNDWPERIHIVEEEE